jgi:hypothetical protein
MCCCAYYFYAIYITVFLLVMYIWVGLRTSTRRSGTLDLHLNLDQAKPSQTKLTAWEACKASLANDNNARGCLISPFWDRDQDRPLRSSTINAIAIQVCCIGQLSVNSYVINEIARITCKTRTPFLFLHVQNKPLSPCKLCICSWERCCREQVR